MMRLKPLRKVTKVMLMRKEIKGGIEGDIYQIKQREHVLYSVVKRHFGTLLLRLLDLE